MSAPYNLSTFELWGIAIVATYCLFWITPSVISDVLRPLYIISSCTYITIAYLSQRLSFKFTAPIALLCSIYLWGLFTHLYATYTLGRTIEVGRVHWYMLEHMLPFFVGSALVSQNLRNIQIINKIILITFSLSAIVGILQFLRFGPAIQLSHLYTYKSIDNWDSVGGGVRAVGLTFHPRILALQSITCLGLTFSSALRNKLDSKNLFLMLFFSATVIATQARQYLLPITIVWIAIGVILIKNNPRKATIVLSAAILLTLVAFILGGKRLAYMLQSTSLSSDASYNYRAQNNWSQADRIMKQFPLTGIGPDQQMFMGQSKMGPDKWTDGQLMESAYRVFASMYGYPGVVLLLCFLASLWYVSIRAIKKGKVSEAHGSAVALLMIAVSITTIGYVTNVFDDFETLPLAMLILAAVVTDPVHQIAPSALCSRRVTS